MRVRSCSVLARDGPAGDGDAPCAECAVDALEREARCVFTGPSAWNDAYGTMPDGSKVSAEALTEEVQKVVGEGVALQSEAEDAIGELYVSILSPPPERVLSVS